MSTGAPRPRDEQFDRLVEKLREALAGVEIQRAEVGPAERRGGRIVVPVTVEAPTEAPGTEAGDEDPEPPSFEEALEYVLEKNRELYRRLS